jgi:hypothetical protein
MSAPSTTPSAPSATPDSVSHAIPCAVWSDPRNWAIAVAQLGWAQDLDSPNPLNSDQPFSALYREATKSRQALPIYQRLPDVGDAVSSRVRRPQETNGTS